MFKRAQRKPVAHQHRGGTRGSGVRHKKRKAKSLIITRTPPTITTPPARHFSSASSQSSSRQPISVFPMATTADNAALASLPEYKQYETELSHGRLVNAEQFLSRIDNIFTHIPMPSVHVELGLKKAHLAMQQSNINMLHNCWRITSRLSPPRSPLQTTPIKSTPHNPCPHGWRCPRLL